MIKFAFFLKTTDLMLTYPECDLTPVDALGILTSRLPAIEEYIVVRKQALPKAVPSGSMRTFSIPKKYSLHIFLRFNQPVKISTPLWLHLEDSMGEYKPCNDLNKWLKETFDGALACHSNTI